MVYGAFIGVVIVLIEYFWLGFMAVFPFFALLIATPVFLLLANILVYPLVHVLHHRVYCKARKHLDRYRDNMTILGMAGSFGKSSTKQYLNQLLGESVLCTPANTNTEL